MEPITIIYLGFTLLTIYLYSLFLLLYFKNKKVYLEKEHIDPTEFPYVSILIPAYNEEETIADTIKAVKALNYPKDKLEIICINDGSTDKTEESIKSFEDIKLISKMNTGKADSLNIAIKESKGELIGVVDADSYPKPDALRLLVQYFKDPEVGAVTSRILVKNRINLLTKLQSFEYCLIAIVRKLLQYVNAVYVTPGALSLYSKKTLNAVNGFMNDTVTEDIELAWRILRAKYSIKMNLLAEVYTTVPSKIGEWWKQRIRWYLGAFQTYYKHRDVIFNKKYSTLGLFAAPICISAIFLGFLGLVIWGYYSTKELIDLFLTSKYVLASNSLYIYLTHFSIPFITILTIFTVTIWIFYSYFLLFGMKNIGRVRLGIKEKSHILIYLFVYLSAFPFLLIHALYRLWTNNIRW